MKTILAVINFYFFYFKLASVFLSIVEEEPNRTCDAYIAYICSMIQYIQFKVVAI